MKSNTFNTMRQLIEENMVLLETGKCSGFLRNVTGSFPSAQRTQLLDTLCYPSYANYFGYDASARMKHILEQCTAEEYVVLTECNYTSPKTIVRMYIDVLTKLLNAGVFDNINTPFTVFTDNTIPSPIPNEAQEDMEKSTIPEGSVLLRQPSLSDNAIHDPLREKLKEKYRLPEGAVLTHSEENKEQTEPYTGNVGAFVELKGSADNSGKPYNGILCEVTFTCPDAKTGEKIRHILHNKFSGTDDYINSNVIVHHESDKDASLVICTEDCRELIDVFNKTSSLFISKTLLNTINRDVSDTESE